MRHGRLRARAARSEQRAARRNLAAGTAPSAPSRGCPQRCERGSAARHGPNERRLKRSLGDGIAPRTERAQLRAASGLILQRLLGERTRKEPEKPQERICRGFEIRHGEHKLSLQHFHLILSSFFFLNSLSPYTKQNPLLFLLLYTLPHKKVKRWEKIIVEQKCFATYTYISTSTIQCTVF